MSTTPPRSSRQRYRLFVDDYLHRRLDEKVDEAQNGARQPVPESTEADEVKQPFWRRLGVRGKRRAYLSSRSEARSPSSSCSR
jgi:hypothetical protein